MKYRALNLEIPESILLVGIVRPAEGVRRPSAVIEHVLNENELQLKLQMEELAKKPRAINKLKKKFEEKSAEARDFSKILWYSIQQSGKRKAAEKLQSAQEEYDLLPKQLAVLEDAICDLKDELREALNGKESQTKAGARQSQSTAPKTAAPQQSATKTQANHRKALESKAQNNRQGQRTHVSNKPASKNQPKTKSTASPASMAEKKASVAGKRKADVSQESPSTKRFRHNSNSLSKLPAQKKSSTAGNDEAGVSKDRAPAKDVKLDSDASPQLTKEKMTQRAGKRKATVSEDETPAKKIKLSKEAASAKAAAEQSNHPEPDCPSISNPDTMKNDKSGISESSSKTAGQRGVVNASGAGSIDGSRSKADFTDGAAKVSAAKESKKRSRPNDDDHDDDSDTERERKRQMLKDESLTNESEELGWVAPKKKITTHLHAKDTEGFNGLMNHRNACFANAVIQLLDAAFDGHDIDALLGEIEELSVSKLTTADPKRMDKDSSWSTSAERKQIMSGLRKKVQEIVKKGRNKTISTAKHFRSLIGDLRTTHETEHEKIISPTLFQAVFAYGSQEDIDESKDDPSVRRKFDGNDQQDAFEYYGRVLNALAADTSIRDKEGLKALFELQGETRDRCTKCEAASDPIEMEPPKYHDVVVDNDNVGKRCSLQRLINKSMKSTKDIKCIKCETGTVEVHSTFTEFPDNLVVRLNRAQVDQKSKGPIKVMRQVDIEDKITFQGIQYELEAVVKHEGPDLEAGHYTIFRKQRSVWYWLKDGICQLVEREKFADSDRVGQTAMVLLKKVTE